MLGQDTREMTSLVQRRCGVLFRAVRCFRR